MGHFWQEGGRSAPFYVNTVIKFPNTNTILIKTLPLIYDLVGYCFVLNYRINFTELYRICHDCGYENAHHRQKVLVKCLKAISDTFFPI